MNNRSLSNLLLCAAVIVTAFLGIGSAHAADLLDTSRATRLIEFDVHAGIGTSTVINNYSSVVPNLSSSKISPGTRMLAGVGVEVPLRDYLAIGTGLDFAINNSSQSMTLLDEPTGMLGNLLTRNHYYTLEVPLVMCLRLNLGSRVRWCSEAGLYLGYGLGGSSNTTALVSSTNPLGQVLISKAQYERSYYESKDPVFCTMRRGDIGMRLATGILISHHFGIKAVLHVGMRDLAKNFGVYDAHAHTLSPAFIISYKL